MLLTESRTASLDDLLIRVAHKLQLPLSLHQDAVERYESIGAWLGRDDGPLRPFNPTIFPQGSLRVRTTVRPRGHAEFDLDLVCELAIDPARTNPLAVFRLVADTITENDRYRPLVELKKRCVRLSYANEFHLDILPAVPDINSGGTCLLVPDRDLRAWVPSNPRGFAGWFDDRAARLLLEKKLAAAEPVPVPQPVDEKPVLTVAVQLLKRWRDLFYEASPDLAPISIVLTTLAGLHYRGEDEPLVTIEHVVDRIIKSIPPDRRLVVCNPSNSREDLSERWDTQPKAYQAFLGGLKNLQQDIVNLNQADGIPACCALLQRLFGESVITEALKEQASEVRQTRDDGRLRIARDSGRLITTSVAAAVTVKRHTFFGDA